MWLGRGRGRAPALAAWLLPAAAAWLLPAAGSAARLLGVEVEKDAGGTRIVLRTDGAPRLTEPFTLTAPSRIVLDLPGVENAAGGERFEVASREVLRARLGMHPGFLRVVLDLAPGAEHAARRVEAGAGGVVLRVGPPQAPLPAVSAAPPSAAPGAAPPPQPTAAAAAGAEKSVGIYGVELQAGADRDRVLVFADGPLAAEVETPDATTVLVRLPGATLAPSAARRIVPAVGGAVSEVLAFVPLASAPEVRLQIKRSPGATPELSRRGSILAVELPLPPSARDVGITLGFADAELAEVVREVGKATGERFLFDETLRGRVTVSVASRLSPAEAVEVLQAALLSLGFAAIPAPGGAWRIVRAEDSPGAPSRVVGAAGAGGVTPVTTLLRLRAATARDVVATLARFAGGDLSATAYAPTNSIVLAGSEARVHRYASVAQALDEADAEAFAVVVLRHRDAAEIAAILGEIGAPRDALPGRTARARFEVWHDARTNTLMLRGPRGEIDELRAWLAQLDVPPEGQGALRVIRPLNADVVALAEVLQKLAAGAVPAPDQVAAASGLAGHSFRVSVHESTGALVVWADPETQRIVREVVDEIDRRPPTVAVDLLVFELNTSGSLALGFDAFVPAGDVDGSDDAVGVVAVEGTPGGPLVPVAPPAGGVLRYAKAPLLIPIIGPGGIPTVAVVPRDTYQITAAEGSVETHVLLRPHLLALSGEEHELAVGDNVPVLVGATTAAGEPVATDPLTIRNDIERRDVGMLLRVRPTAGQEGDVRLELDVEASRVRPLPPGVAERTGPVIEQRKLSVVTRLETGQVAVLGMLQEPITRERERGVPFLRDVPILGWLFRSVLSERVNRQLVIAVEAGIERSQAERVADGIRFRLAFERALARQGSLAQRGEAWALLVATRSSEEEARALASALDGPVQVVRWEWAGEERFDVYLGSFARLPDAVAASATLSAAGFRPELVALPPHELAQARPEAPRAHR